MRNATRTCLALALLLGALAALPSSVSAAGRHIDQTQCFSFPQVLPDGSVVIFTQCQRVEGVLNDTVAPSGNITHVFNGTVTTTLAIDDVPQPDSTLTFESHFVTVTKDGSQQVVNQQFTSTQTINGQQCVATGHLQFSNGEFRFNRPTFSCS